MTNRRKRVLRDIGVVLLSGLVLFLIFLEHLGELLRKVIGKRVDAWLRRRSSLLALVIFAFAIGVYVILEWPKYHAWGRLSWAGTFEGSFWWVVQHVWAFSVLSYLFKVYGARFPWMLRAYGWYRWAHDFVLDLPVIRTARLHVRMLKWRLNVSYRRYRERAPRMSLFAMSLRWWHKLRPRR